MLHVNVTGTDFNSLDPAVNYDNDGAQLLYATCAKLLNYRDSIAPSGSVPEPEVAAALPEGSADGRTYTFTIRPGFRFSNGDPVTSADFAYAINRVLDPRLHSPGQAFLEDVVGARAVIDGRAKTARGVVVDGASLRISLTAPAPDFLARIAMNFFCAVPAGSPVRAGGFDTLPSAGPYYVAARTVGSVTLKRNPYYGGTRPRHLDEIDFRGFAEGYQSTAEIERGQADYDVHGVPTSLNRDLALRYGVNRGRLFAHPTTSIQYLALNTSRPPFRDPSVRRAVAYALDRTALRRAAGYLSGKVTDQILPPSLPGFHDAKLYPARPDLARARELMRGRRVRALLDVSEGPDAMLAPIVADNLRAIGIDVRVKSVPFHLWASTVQRRSSSYDMVLAGWFVDYLDPYDFLNILLDGRTIAERNNQNLAHFDDPAYNRRLRAAARLFGAARYAAYARLDADLMRDAVPIVPFLNPYRVEFVSARVGCVVLAPAAGGLDYSAACLR